MVYKLVCFDMDGVIFRDINFWMELHKKFGTLKKGIKLTERYLHTDYDRLVEEVVVKLWKGKDAKPYYDLVNSIEYMPGVKDALEKLHQKGYKTVIVSASSIDVARRAQKDIGIDYIYANELIIREGRVSGEFKWPVGVGKERKAQIIRDLCSRIGISPKEVIYIGDSDTDIEAFKEVGLAIAFNTSSQNLKEAADYVVESSNLADILKYIP